MQWDVKAGRWLVGDCLERMREIPDGSVDMVLCDLPYGTTQCAWDVPISLERVWSEYWRVGRPNAPVVLFAAQPFTSALVMSQVKFFRYDWVWRKEKGTGHLNAKKMPLRDKEDILVFYRKPPCFSPQFAKGKPYNGTARVGKKRQQAEVYGKHGVTREDNPGIRYPRQVLDFTSAGAGSIHPTQKPVALFEYLIRTYTQPGDLVLDNTAGSGTTAVAAEQAGRRWLCIERDLDYSLAALDRIASL